MPRVVHFDISAEDTARAAEFYRQVFDWEITKWEGPVDYWLVTTGPGDEPGIDGGLAQRSPGYEGTYNTIDVPSVDEASSKVMEAGGEVIREKQPVPGVGYLAYCKDTEGNIFGLMEEDPSAGQ